MGHAGIAFCFGWQDAVYAYSPAARSISSARKRLWQTTVELALLAAYGIYYTVSDFKPGNAQPIRRVPTGDISPYRLASPSGG